MAISARPRPEKGIYFQQGSSCFFREEFGIGFSPSGQILITCICGKQFDFAENRNKRVPSLADCPKCLTDYDLDQDGDRFHITRPFTNSQIILEIVGFTKRHPNPVVTRQKKNIKLTSSQKSKLCQ